MNIYQCFIFVVPGGWYRTAVERASLDGLGAPQHPNPHNPLSQSPPIIHPLPPLILYPIIYLFNLTIIHPYLNSYNSLTLTLQNLILLDIKSI